jgi:hypothetical protein
MTIPHTEEPAQQPPRRPFFRSLMAIAVVAGIGALILLFFTRISWEFGGGLTPAGDFTTIALLFLLGVAPAAALLVQSLRRLPERSVAGIVVAVLILGGVAVIFAPSLIAAAGSLG